MTPSCTGNNRVPKRIPAWHRCCLTYETSGEIRSQLMNKVDLSPSAKPTNPNPPYCSQEASLSGANTKSVSAIFPPCPRNPSNSVHRRNQLNPHNFTTNPQTISPPHSLQQRCRLRRNSHTPTSQSTNPKRYVKIPPIAPWIAPFRALRIG